MPQAEKPAMTSGPGAQSRRTDGGPASKQALRYVANMPNYGDGQALMDMQASAPMAKTNNPPASAAASSMQPQQGGQAQPQPQQPIVPLTAGTQRPNEPVTAGAAGGAGPGISALGFTPGQIAPGGQSAKDAVSALASHPDASPELQRLAQLLGKQFMANNSTDPNLNLANQISQSYPRASVTTKAAGIASGDPAIANTAASVDSVAQTANALQQHQATYNSSGWWNTILKDTKDVASAVTGFVAKAPVIGTLAQWASKPLQEVQKDYKFIHSLWADQGPAAGILGTLGVIAGGTIGALGGPEGIALGASAAGALERNILGRVVPNFKSSFDKSNDPNYNVSFGRDLAHGLSNVPGFGALTNTDKGFGQIVSGIADATFDFSADPLAKVGKIYGKVKNGNYLAEAKDEAGNVMRDQSGLPIVKATLPLASMSDSVDSFLKTAAPTVQNSSQLLDAYNNTFNFQFRAAVKDIAELKNPVDIQVKYKNSNITTPLANALAKADNEQAVLNVLGRSMYSQEFAQAATPTGALVLPTRTLGKMFSDNFGAEAIRSSKQATTLNDEMNFLLPKFSTVMVPKMETAVDKTTGEITTQQATNEFGQPVMTAKLDQNGEVVRKAIAPVWARNPKQLPENIMNAMASKVRTFTGQKALSTNQQLMKQSGEKIDFSDPNAGVTVYNLLNYSMPSSVAKEYAAKVMTAENDNERRGLLRAAQVEVLKAAGLPA